MAESEQNTVFRQETLDRISSPEQLNGYLRVTGPGIWAVLAAVILLLAAVLVWSAVGTLETTAGAKVVVENGSAQVIPSGAQALSAGMPLRVGGQEYVLFAADTDEYGRVTGAAQVSLPDGTYDGTVVVERTRPADFLLTGR